MLIVAEMSGQGLGVRGMGHGRNDDQNQFDAVDRLGDLVRCPMQPSDSCQRFAGDLDRTGLKDRGHVGMKAFELKEGNLVSGQCHVGGNGACSVSAAHYRYASRSHHSFPELIHSGTFNGQASWR